MNVMLFSNCNNVKVEDKLNYVLDQNWVFLPSSTQKKVDVFYLYPTVSSNESGIMDVTNPIERDLALGVFKSQASVFEKSTNMFAPFYRQLSTQGRPEDPNAPVSECKQFMFGLADVEVAFDYFLENLNNGRPFIIAGHSQGAMAALELIKKRFGNNKKLKKQLVAAYVIGCTVTDSDLEISGLKAAKSANDLGVIITFNTQSTTSAGGPMLSPGAHCINPLNWKTDNSVALASENLGAVFYNNNTGEFLREQKNYCGAQINTETGALLTSLPAGEVDKLEFGPYSEGVYHRYDFAIWYRNIEQNIEQRIEAYFYGI